MWGWNPSVSITGTNSSWYLSQAREKGTRIITVDPYYNEAAATFAHEWIPIKPGTDAAVLIAMAYVMIKENPNDPLAETYPLQLLTSHSKRRANAQFDNIPWLRGLINTQLPESDIGYLNYK